MNEFVLMQNEFDIVVDGFCDAPRTFDNLFLRLLPFPAHSTVQVWMGTEILDRLVAPIPALIVTSPTGDGHYADTLTKHIYWSGATALRITAFSDKDNDGVFTGGKPQFSIYVEDNTVETEETTWGAVKALYRNQ
jgi:hypothetical protein